MQFETALMYNYYCYREPRTCEEIKELLQVRYHSYINSRVKMFIPENDFGIDIDEWDKNASHYGLYHCTPEKESPIGYMRVIVESAQRFKDNIFQIAEECSAEMLALAKTTPRVPFSVMDYFPKAVSLIAIEMKRMQNENEKLCEAGRFALIPQARSLRLSRFMIECSIAIFYFGRLPYNAVISCNELHQLIYYYYRFKSVAEAAVEKSGGYASLLLLLLRYKTDYPVALKSKLENMADEYNRDEMICLNVKQK